MGKNTHGSFLIDNKGKVLVSPIYDDISITGFGEGICGVIKDGKWGFIDKIGTEFIPFIYETVFGCNEGLYGVRKDGKCGFIDKTGKEFIPQF